MEGGLVGVRQPSTLRFALSYSLSLLPLSREAPSYRRDLPRAVVCGAGLAFHALVFALRPRAARGRRRTCEL